MRIAHLLRKYNPTEWAGTETAVQRLVSGLQEHRVDSVVYCPRIRERMTFDPLARSGCTVKRFRAFLPVWGVSKQQKQRLVAMGGNLMSFDLIVSLLREAEISLFHTHTLSRLGGIALTVARWRKLPLVVTIHGGALDLPEAVKEILSKPLEGGVEWGKVFGAFLRSRQLLSEADAIIACNQNELNLLRRKFPRKRILFQPHGVPVNLYSRDFREKASEAFPSIRGKQVLLSVARIDPVKNQSWLIERASELLKRHPNILLVLVGSCTHEEYRLSIERQIRQCGLEHRALLTGGLPADDPRLIGLFQQARAMVLPSLAEPFGLVIIEAWAAGAMVISSRTSGASTLVRHGENGWLFDLNDTASFHQAVDRTLEQPDWAARLAEAGREQVRIQYDTSIIAGQIKAVYDELIESGRADS